MNRLGGRSALAGVIVWTLVAFASPARADTKNACVTTCDGAQSSDEARKVAGVVEPMLQTIRSCLAGVSGGDAIRPTALATVAGAGTVRTVNVIQIGAGGHEKLACMPKLASVASGTGATEMLLCELRCDAPPAGEHPTSVPSNDKDWPSPTPAPKRQTQTWYGWQILIADGGTLLLWIVGGAVAASSSSGGSSGGGIAGLGLLNYFFAPPIIHLAHGRVGPAFGSLGMRVLAPLGGVFVGALAGAVIDPSQGGEIGSDGIGVGAVVGLIGGYAAAVAIDAGLLSYEKVETTDKSAPGGKAQAFRVLPSLVLTPTPQGGFLGTGGLTGTF